MKRTNIYAPHMCLISRKAVTAQNHLFKPKNNYFNFFSLRINSCEIILFLYIKFSLKTTSNYWQWDVWIFSQIKSTRLLTKNLETWKTSMFLIYNASHVLCTMKTFSMFSVCFQVGWYRFLNFCLGHVYTDGIKVEFFSRHKRAKHAFQRP